MLGVKCSHAGAVVHFDFAHRTKRQIREECFADTAQADEGEARRKKRRESPKGREREEMISDGIAENCGWTLEPPERRGAGRRTRGPFSLDFRAGRQILNEARGQLFHSSYHNIFSERFYRRQFLPPGKLTLLRARLFLCFSHGHLLVEFFSGDGLSRRPNWLS